MSREEAIEVIKAYRDNLTNSTSNQLDGDIKAFEMAIQALSQEPCTVSVSEKEPNEITEEVTLRFFKNSLKVRWHDFVIYNVEWLKKNWQMEMDIVCGVKPCDDAISREAVIQTLNKMDRYTATELTLCDTDKKFPANEVFIVDDVYEQIAEQLPSVTQKSGKWIVGRISPTKLRGENLIEYRCSECDRAIRCTESQLVNYPYCHCGAKMIEPQEFSQG